MTIGDWIGLATLVSLVIGLYKIFQEARASKATADIAAANAEIAAANAQIASTHAQEATAGIAEVAGLAKEIVTNTNGMQKRMEELARADERHIADERGPPA